MADTPRWLLLVTHLPPKPDYLRVKLRRRIQRIGALPLKGSVYVLPLRDETTEDLMWLRAELLADGADAVVFAATPLAGVTDAQLAALFGDALADDADAAEPTAEEPRDERATGRTWVTRAGVFVDRIASAWLVRRFIDPEARFAFTSDARYAPRSGEVRFDMFEGEYTHEGDRCTFETLLARFDLDAPALRAIGEIVHDVDIRDGKFERPEAAGVEAVLAGLVHEEPDDARRLERGAAIFDALYARLAGADR